MIAIERGPFAAGGSATMEASGLRPTIEKRTQARSPKSFSYLVRPQGFEPRTR